MANTNSTTLAQSSSQYWSITNGSQSGLGFTGNNTIAGWFKPSSGPSSGIDETLFSKYSNSSPQRGLLYTYENSGGTLRIHVRISPDGSNVTEGWINQTLNTGTWYHLAFVYSTAGTVVIYVNGSSIGTVSSLDTSIFNNTAPFAVGFCDAVAKTFDGEVDEVVAYNASLSSGTISSLFNTPCAPSTTNLISRWAFDNNGSDSQGSNTLTGTNSPTFTTDVAFSCGGGATVSCLALLGVG